MPSILWSSAVVIFTGRILTLDPDRPRAEGMVVENGRIVAIGDLPNLEQVAGPEAERIEASRHRRSRTPSIVHPRDRRRLAELGVMASLQPISRASTAAERVPSSNHEAEPRSSSTAR